MSNCFSEDSFVTAILEFDHVAVRGHRIANRVITYYFEPSQLT